MKHLFILLATLALSLSVGAQRISRCDVNNDTKVNTADIVAVYGYIIQGEASGIPRDHANVNGDNNVNSADVVAIYNYLISGQEPVLTYKVDDVEFTMIPVEGGTFEMGKSADGNDVEPIHSVTLSSYAIGETEVTQALWAAVMGSNPSYKTGDDKPVELVSWNDCQDFVTKLNAELADQLPDGKVFRLPTEAEWEFAARGGNKSEAYIFSGGNTLSDVAWYRENSGNATHNVKLKTSNELGIYDMSGNVAEWCYDWWAKYSSEAQTNPIGPESGSWRVYRGGAMNNDPGNCSITGRSNADPEQSFINTGLRLVLGSPYSVTKTTTYSVGDVEFGMVDVDGGTFQMGATPEQGETYANEMPDHSVTLNPYSIGETEVTQALWTAVMGSNPSHFQGDDLPVESVSWNDCQDFVAALNEQLAGQLPEGKVFRLPTEAEWEYAARGGKWSKGYMYSGGNAAGDVAWYKNNSDETTHPVAQKLANELGLYDMNGNVCEWCQDWYELYSSDAQTNPTGPTIGTSRVGRGGAWSFDAYHIAARFSAQPVDAGHTVGLRLVLGDPLEVFKVKAYSVDGVEFNMIDVDGDEFMMGSDPEEEYHSDDEELHWVQVASYAIGETEVTQALWKAVMGSNPSDFKGDNLPVEKVSWDDCQEFVTKLNTELADQLPEGKVFRLPTEAEWEFAARGGSLNHFYMYSGSNTLDDVAWYMDNCFSTNDVKTKAPNELGLYDMSGNVCEWCIDLYGAYGSDSQDNPTGATSGTDRVMRGGSWYDSSAACRVAWRSSADPASAYHLAGLRLALGSPIDLTPKIPSTVYSVGDVEFKMVDVEGGTFEMGATPEQENSNSDEKPVHSVTLSSYAIGESEVTQALWKAVMGANPSLWEGDNLPVESVSWNDCQNFIKHLNIMMADQLPEGKVFRLPTEAEWEFAARGGNKSQGTQYSGSATLDDVAWHAGNSDNTTHDVMTKAPNELGLYDMSGNVDEWCHDWLGGYPSSAQTNPTGPKTWSTYMGQKRIYRGGSYRNETTYSTFFRTAYRHYAEPTKAYIFSGLRLVLGDPLPVPTVSYSANGVSFEMAVVDGGTFEMGKSAVDDTETVHSVTLSGYYIATTEVTQALWKAVMGSNPSNHQGNSLLPVENVSWTDCQTFLSKLNTLLDSQIPSDLWFRLPTEAEWEFAARGGYKSMETVFSGSNTIDDVAWYKNNSSGQTQPVARKQPNELGLYDMSGNVDEWCQDWYGAYSSDAQTNPTGPSSSTDFRVLRGGNFSENDSYCRMTLRSSLPPDSSQGAIGLRIVLARMF